MPIRDQAKWEKLLANLTFGAQGATQTHTWKGLREFKTTFALGTEELGEDEVYKLLKYLHNSVIQAPEVAHTKKRWETNADHSRGTVLWSMFKTRGSHTDTMLEGWGKGIGEPLGRDTLCVREVDKTLQTRCIYAPRDLRKLGWRRVKNNSKAARASTPSTSRRHSYIEAKVRVQGIV